MKGIDLKLISEINKKEKQIKVNSTPDVFSNILNKQIHLFNDQIKDKRKESFYLEMSMLLSAGMNIRSVLDLILTEMNKKDERAVFENLKDEIVRGAALSEAMKSSKKFSEYEYFSIKIGEETAKLPEVLKDLSTFYNKKIRQRRKIIAALTYPAIISCFAIIAVLFMLNFVVPMFADVFKRFGGELPAITKFILKASNLLKASFWLISFLLMSFIFFIISQRRKIWFRNLSGSIILKTPVAGRLVHKIYLSRFCNSMQLMIASKVSMLRSITLMRQMIGFYPLEITLKKVEQDILEGKPLHQSLSAFAIYPPKMIALIKAGEEVNKLDFFFNTLFEQYSEETEHQTTLLGNFIEPFIIIFLGVVVGIILIAMYLPLFQLGQNF
jgi:type IV pilus assembly protein PilC